MYITGSHQTRIHKGDKRFHESGTGSNKKDQNVSRYSYYVRLSSRQNVDLLKEITDMKNSRTTHKFDDRLFGISTANVLILTNGIIKIEFESLCSFLP